MHLSVVFTLALLLVACSFAPAAACPFAIHSGDVAATSAIVQASFAHPSCRPNPHALAAVSRFVLATSPRITRATTIRTRNISVTAFAGLDPRQYPGGYVAKVALAGLTPGNVYYYRFVSPAGHRSPVCRFRTLPPSGPVRFVLFTDANTPPYTVLRHAAAFDPHFALLNGDGIQASDRADGARVRPTQHYYRSLYTAQQRSAAYGGGPWLRNLLRRVPVFATWDDDEVFNGYSGRSGHPVVVDENSVRGYDRFGLPILENRIPPRLVSALFNVGSRMFFEMYAIPPAHRLDKDDPLPRNAPRLYSSQSRLFRKVAIPGADIFILDTRQYRDTSLSATTSIPVRPRGTGPNFTCAGPYASAPLCGVFRGPHGGAEREYRGARARHRTLLGRAQLAWLKRGLRNSRAKFKLIMSSAYAIDFYLSPEETWEGYWAERQSLMSFIERHAIANTVFLSSGALGAVFSRLNPASKGKVAIHEVITGAIGQYIASSAAGPVTPIFEQYARTFAANSHLLPAKQSAIKFMTLDKSNFVRIEVSNGTLTAECVGEDGEVIMDSKGVQGRYVVG